MAFVPGNNYSYIKTLSVAGLATQIATGVTILEAITVNSAASAYTIGIIDGTSGTTVNVAQLSKLVTGTYLYPSLVLKNGLRIVTTGAVAINPNVTVVWRQG